MKRRALMTVLLSMTLTLAQIASVGAVTLEEVQEQKAATSSKLQEVQAQQSDTASKLGGLQNSIGVLENKLTEDGLHSLTEEENAKLPGIFRIFSGKRGGK